MLCPVCEVNMARIRYEAMVFHNCRTCRGHLIADHRVDRMKKMSVKSLEQLKSEAVLAFVADEEVRRRCPRCRLPMVKQGFRRPVDYKIDRCKSCELAWFDGGKLALMQLGFQFSDKGKEAAVMRRRLLEMNAEERAEFDANLQRCRDNPANEQPLMLKLGGAAVSLLLHNPYGF